MKADRLLQAFPMIGEDPARIQQLRQVVVALAIARKLTSDSLSLSPVEMLSKVEQAKTDLYRQRAIPKPRNPKPVEQDEFPEAFRDSGQFAPLASLARIEKGLTGIRQAKPGPFPLVVTGAERVTCDHFDFDAAAAIVPLVSSTGHGHASIHRLHYQEGKFALGTILAAVIPYDPSLVSARFIFEYLSAFKQELLVTRMTGTANVTLSVGRIAEVPVPLVDPGTQAKVDELMGLLDGLEAARQRREETRDRLTVSSLVRLTAADAEPETFPTHARFALYTLPALTTRPDQIKQLRQTILSLAVRGRLVGQNPLDEPVSQALERWLNEKLFSLPKGKRKKLLETWRKVKSSSPNELPPSWIWVTAEELCEEIVDCPHSTPKFMDNGIACLDTNSVKSSGLLYEKLRFVSEETYAVRNRRLVPRPGDVVFAREGSVGEAVIVPPDFKCCLGQRVMLFRPGPVVSPEWFKLAISEPSALRRLMTLHKGIGAKHVNVRDMRMSLQPLPSMAEQNRIVARVDELMLICDQLEVALSTADSTRCRLLDVLLHEALIESNPDREAA